MEKNNKHHNFLAYINNPMSKESIMVIYDANNIRFEKCELYGDFIQSLLLIIFDTYMGDEYTDSEGQLKHFKWCWDKNVKNFSKEGFIFNSEFVFEYFKDYISEVFYCYSEKGLGYVDEISLNLWKNIFDYEKSKTNSDVDTLVELYKLFEKDSKSLFLKK